ncbi:hypothetical protein CVU82_01400 [Candidatus Falkowbacteria bacterium HGW-Falkowbacteria-1]|uniref:Uncharacterized protein n=1 Tax=Candidatus Falkowbacteria bacterium HGW-Falkowbacteria-1 TaxID=2013768 RepID=A0A2N2EAU5_9BACT|nr:MAG: hypothetical protein CVU82_01400 [Candidatus Falkowbacteria bacterium HGW-Falkowbacteria-1]
MEILKCLKKNILLLFILLLSLIVNVGAIFYYIYELNWLSWFFILFFSIFGVSIFFYFITYKNYQQEFKSGEKHKIKIVDVILFSLSLISFLFLLYVLYISSSSLAIISPWHFLPAYFFLVFSVFLTLVLSGFYLKSYFSKVLLIFVYFLFFSVSFFIYKFAFGYDQLLHQRALSEILQFGVINPKTFYYIGQYSLEFFLIKSLPFSLETISRGLVPFLSAVLVPLSFLFNFKDRNKNIYFVLLLLLFLPFSIFTYTVPQNLAFLFLTLIIIFSFNSDFIEKRGGFLFLFSLALSSFFIHPLAGIPALVFVFILFLSFRLSSVILTEFSARGRAGKSISACHLDRESCGATCERGDLLPFVLDLSTHSSLCSLFGRGDKKETSLCSSLGRGDKKETSLCSSFGRGDKKETSLCSSFGRGDKDKCFPLLFRQSEWFRCRRGLIQRILIVFSYASQVLILPILLLFVGGKFSWPKLSFDFLIPSILGQENVFLNFVYFFFFNKFYIFFILIIFSVYFFIKKYKFTNIFVLNFLALFFSYLLSLFISFPFLSNIDKSSYSNRILIISLLFLIPVFYNFFSGLLDKIKVKDFYFRLYVAIFFVLFLISSLYLNYPRKDNYFNSRGYSVSSFDFEAVKLIEEKKINDNYIVLANQQVGAAAVKEFGFKRYYDGWFYYSVQTGGLLYDYYLKMLENPEGELIEGLLLQVKADNAYVVVNDYWWAFDRIVNELKVEADSYYEVGDGKIFIFHFVK